MDCPGEYLKRERELRDISLDDISKEIKVPVKLLRALEADDYPSMPHTAFVKGFIRAYCKYLGVDENDALLRYELYLQEVAEFEKPAVKPKSMDVRERSFPVRKSLAASLVVVAIIIIAAIYFISSSPDDTAQVSVPEEAPAPAKEVAKVVEEETLKPEGKALKELKKEFSLAPHKEIPVEKAKQQETTDTEIEVQSEAVTPEVVEEVSKVKLPEFVEPAPLELSEGEHLLRLHATQVAWMKIVIDTNDPFEVLMQPGEILQWKGKVFFCS
jgi:cytoskeletal protein RodZ